MLNELMVENVAQLHDARYCAAVGVKYLSFQMTPRNPTALSAAMVKEIVDWLSGVTCIARFDEGDVASMSPIMEEAWLNSVCVPSKLAPSLQFRGDVEVFIDCTDLAQEAVDLEEALLKLHASHSTGLFIIDETQAQLLAAATRCLRPEALVIRLAHSPSILHHTNAAILSIGNAITDPEGFIDYERGDAYLESIGQLA